MISTRGRYALRVMVDLAELNDAGFVPLNSIAERQNISVKYLELILKTLVQRGLLKGHRGKGGGYMLTRKPEEYSVGEILHCIEDNLAPVSCIRDGSITCDHAELCLTIPMWKELDEITNKYLESITLADLLSGDKWKGT